LAYKNNVTMTKRYYTIKYRLQTLTYELFNKNNKSYYVSLGLLSYNNREIVEDTWNKIKE
jgi:hypothetical protein